MIIADLYFNTKIEPNYVLPNNISVLHFINSDGFYWANRPTKHTLKDFSCIILFHPKFPTNYPDSVVGILQLKLTKIDNFFFCVIHTYICVVVW